MIGSDFNLCYITFRQIAPIDTEIYPIEQYHGAIAPDLMQEEPIAADLAEGYDPRQKEFLASRLGIAFVYFNVEYDSQGDAEFVKQWQFGENVTVHTASDMGENFLIAVNTLPQHKQDIRKHGSRGT